MSSDFLSVYLYQGFLCGITLYLAHIKVVDKEPLPSSLLNMQACLSIGIGSSVQKLSKASFMSVHYQRAGKVRDAFL